MLNKNLSLIIAGFVLFVASLYLFNERTRGSESDLSLSSSGLLSHEDHGLDQDIVQFSRLRSVFESWMKSHSKLYHSAGEKERRFANFIASWKRVIQHNMLSKDSTYKLGLNAFADLSDEEFAEFIGTKQKLKECWTVEDRERMQNRPAEDRIMTEGFLPRTKNWVDEGIVSRVKNQGRCGSCWAFAAVGALEAHYKKRHGKPVEFSEQQLLDCSYAYGNYGCNGGFPARAFEHIRLDGGLETSADYPYEMASNDSCRMDRNRATLTVKRVVNVTESSEKELEYAVAFAGPVSVAYLVATDFRLYANGVYKTEECGDPKPKDLTHAVLAVGYGVAFDGTKYWLLKNSWGEDWGVKGYFMMERGRNLCGIADCAAYAVVG